MNPAGLPSAKGKELFGEKNLNESFMM